MTIRILLVDDHTVVRKGLRTFLSFDPELEVVGEAADGNQALRLVRELTPDVVLMDLVMPGMDGITATAAIRRELPETEVVALTSVLEDASVVGAVRAGAIGYLLKDTQAEALCQAIKAAAGQVQLTPKAAAHLMQAISIPKGTEALTERETEVLRLLAQGQSNKQIAHSLHNTEKTNKTHVSRILSKLGVQSRTQATLARWTWYFARLKTWSSWRYVTMGSALIRWVPFRAISVCAQCRSVSTTWVAYSRLRALQGKERTCSRKFPSGK